MKYMANLIYAPVVLIGIIVVIVCATARIFNGKRTVPGIFVGLVIMGLGLYPPLKAGCFGLTVPRTFSAEAWAKTEPEDRHFMVENLQEQHTLTGMTAGEVTALLGEPDYIKADTLYSYIIDMPFDESTLDLTLANGVVTETGITLEH